ncbi:unnamed protein product, partial [Polarella glacialis]
ATFEPPSLSSTIAVQPPTQPEEPPQAQQYSSSAKRGTLPLKEALLPKTSTSGSSNERWSSKAPCHNYSYAKPPSVKTLLRPNAVEEDEEEEEEELRKFWGLQVSKDKLICAKLCCARLSCSWSCKLLVLVAAVQGLFFTGPLSQPLWIPISRRAACGSCGDAGGCPISMGSKAPLAVTLAHGKGAFYMKPGG